MSEFLSLIAASEVPNGTMKAVEVEGHDFLVANVGGEFFVTDAHCPHLHGNLSRGTLEGTVLTCPLHGSQFDVRDGSVIRWTDWGDTLRKVGSLVRHPRRLRTYEAEVVDGIVKVGPQKEPPDTL